MIVRETRLAFLSIGMCFLVGCGPSIYSLKIRLIEDPSAVVVDSPRIVIDDMRPKKDRVPHLGRDISRCERWFGDDTFIPSKVAYLEKLFAEVTQAESAIHLRLTRFAVIEYCEHTIRGNASAAAAIASGSVPGFNEAPVIGDTVVLRVAGEVNGVPFDVSRQFDYGSIYTSPRRPSSYLTYRILLRARLEEIVDEIVVKTLRIG